MATKHDNRTLDRCADDEPIFVLRAQDKSSPSVILYWLQANPQIPDYKFREAMETIRQMRGWPERKLAD